MHDVSKNDFLIDTVCGPNDCSTTIAVDVGPGSLAKISVIGIGETMISVACISLSTFFGVHISLAKISVGVLV